MYEDKTLQCRECGQDFVFTAGEQEFYQQKGLQNEPGRCPECRQKRRAQMSAARGEQAPREMHKITCAECGNEVKCPSSPRMTSRSIAVPATIACAYAVSAPTHRRWPFLSSARGSAAMAARPLMGASCGLRILLLPASISLHPPLAACYPTRHPGLCEPRPSPSPRYTGVQRCYNLVARVYRRLDAICRSPRSQLASLADRSNTGQVWVETWRDLRIRR